MNTLISTSGRGMKIVIKITPDGLNTKKIISNMNLNPSHINMCFMSAKDSGVLANLTTEQMTERNPA